MHTREMLAGAGIGAALAFMLDPGRGAARRAWVGDKVTRAARRTREGLDTAARDMGNRARGIAAASRARVWDRTVDDGVLVERVRAVLGRASSHPRAIHVEARDGAVTLTGQVLTSELDRVLSQVKWVRGVRAVNDQLQCHETGEGIPSLQGEGRVAGPSLDILQSRWAPATRALVGASVLGAVAGGLAFATRGRRPAYGSARLG